MIAKFFVEEGPLTGLILTLDNGEQWTIGRDPDQCQLLLEDAQIERKHLFCQKDGDIYTLSDISEAQNVVINEEPLLEPTPLSDGDSIRIGSTILRFLSTEFEPVSFESQTIEYEDSIESEEVQDEVDPKLADLSEREQEEEGAFDEPIEDEQVEETSSEDDADELETDHDLTGEEQEELLSEQELVEDAADEAESDDLTGEEQEEPLLDDAAEQIGSAREDRLEEITDEQEQAPFEQIEEFHVDLTQSARFILKVIAGPNTGAEFTIDIGKDYLIGTNTITCDIVFHDLSVSGEHASLRINEDGKAVIKDLNSRNGILIDQKKIEKQAELDSNGIVTIGTTSFFLIDKEAPQETIVTPVFEPQEEEITEDFVDEIEQEVESASEQEQKKPTFISGALILSVIMVGFVCLLGLGIFSLHNPKTVELPDRNYSAEIQEALSDFPAVKFNYNSSTHQLFLVGHVLNGVKLNEMHYKLQGLPFLKGLDNNVVDDEAVWQEMNLLLAKLPEFKGVSMHASDPGIFVLNGYLKTNKQGAALADYMNLNFNYLSNLQTRVVIEQQVAEEVTSLLSQKGFRGVESKFVNGELSLTGYIGSTQTYDFDHVMRVMGEVPGVRTIMNHVVVVSPEQQVVDLTTRFPGRFKVTGFSKHGDVNVNVVINGKILSRGDTLDGLTITSIQPHAVFLEKEGLKYKIDYNK